MRLSVRRWLPPVLLIVAAMAAYGSARASDAVLRVATLGQIDSFDPDLGQDIAGVSARDAVYDGLVSYGPGRPEIVGRLATRWTVSADELTYRFTLRKGVTFHDGARMTSADVRASFERRLAMGGMLAQRLDGVAATEAPDADTFVIRLNRPLPWLLDVLAGAWGPKVLSAAALAEHDAAGKDAGRAWLRTHDAGTGPYRLAATDAGGARLARFDGYWGEAPWFAAIDIAAIPDTATQVLRLRAGKLDVVANAYPPTTFEPLPAKFAVTALPSDSLILAEVNPLGQLVDPETRRAALVGLNAKYWLSVAFHNNATVAGALYSSAMFRAPDPIDLPDDVEVAKQIVERLRDPRLVVGYPANQADLLRQSVDLMLSNLQAIGFDASAVPVVSAAAFAAHLAEAPDVYVLCANPGEADPQAQAPKFYVSNAPGNVYGMIDPAAVRLVRQAELVTVREDRVRRYQMAARKLFVGGGFVPLAEPAGILVHRADLSGFAARAGYPPGAFIYALVAGALASDAD